MRAEIQVRGGAGRIGGRGREIQSAVGGPAGSPGRRACREWAGDGRLRLTLKRVTRIASAWEGGLKFLSAGHI